jgi:hypothetical protein
VKAWTLWQPWALLVVRGLKTWETRSRPVSYRGEVAIHASKNMKHLALLPELLAEAGIPEALRDLPPLGLWPSGAVIGVVTVVECFPTEEVLKGMKITRQERAFGNYAAGRYAIRLENARQLSQPVRASGALGLWATGPALAGAISQELAAAR